MRRLLSAAFSLLLIASTLAGAATPVAVRAQQAVQSIFLGDDTCGESTYACAFPFVRVKQRYLHVVLHDLAGNDDWHVDVGQTCSTAVQVVGGLPIEPSGYLEAVVDLRETSPAGELACFKFSGRNGWWVTYYAAYLDDNPAADADLVYHGYQGLNGRPDLPDLDIAYIHRSPSFAFDSTLNNPAVGQQVLYAAHVRNSGNQPAGPFAYTWYLDHRVVGRGSWSEPISPGSEVILPLTQRWDAAPHFLTLSLSYAGAQISTSNDDLTIDTHGLLLGFWVEQSAYNYFLRNQWEYCQDYSCGGSDSLEDWLQRQVTTWNRALAGAIGPDAPAGAADRVYLDKLTVVPDGALPLHGSQASNTPDDQDHTVDLEWGLPASAISGYRLGGDGGFDVDWGLIHELGHARYLADLYRFDMQSGGDNQLTVTRADGLPALASSASQARPGDIVPFTADRQQFLYEDLAHDLMSCTCFPGYSEYTAMVLNRIQGRRARCGNTNPPCNLGEWLQEIPADTRLRLIGPDSAASRDDAQVRLYSDRGTTYNGHAFDDAHVRVLSPTSSTVDLGGDPFGSGDSLYSAGRDLLLIDMRQGGGDSYCFLEPAVLNLAYWHGYRTPSSPATFTLHVGEAVNNRCAIDQPPALINEPFATSPFRSKVVERVIAQNSGQTRMQVSVRLVDGAEPPHPMRKRRLLLSTAAGHQLAEGTTTNDGRLTFTIPRLRGSLRLTDQTDDHLLIPVPTQAPQH